MRRDRWPKRRGACPAKRTTLNFDRVPGERVILILGAPRSGTSWLGKIFDSHPDVLYRHEPDQALRSLNIPTVCQAPALESYAFAARRYMRSLLATSTIKTSGVAPTFPKRFHGPLARHARMGLTTMLRAAGKLPPARGFVRDVHIPDMIDPARSADLRIVMKSVIARGRARLYADSLPGSKVIFLLRDPWGQVASTLRGLALRKFEKSLPLNEILETEQAARYPISASRLEAMPLAEQLAWSWVILNEKALDDLRGRPGLQLVHYHELCSDPERETRDLFKFADLPWDQQTAGFLNRCREAPRLDRYYGVFKNPDAAMNRWRTELTDDDQRRIARVVGQSTLARFYALSEEAPDYVAGQPRRVLAG